MRIHNRLHLDDYFLIFSCVCITVGTALCYVYIGLLYWIQELDLNPTRSSYLLAEHIDFIADINLIERLVSVFTTLMFTAIFAVKLAYLAFFRRLVDRIRPLIIYWRVVTAITILSFPIGIILSFLACTQTGPDVGKHITFVIFLIGLKPLTSEVRPTFRYPPWSSLRRCWHLSRYRHRRIACRHPHSASLACQYQVTAEVHRRSFSLLESTHGCCRCHPSIQSHLSRKP